MFSSHFKSLEMVKPRKRQDSTMATGVSPSMMGVGGAAFLLKSTTISTVFSALSSRLLQLHQLCSRSLLYADSSPPEMRPIRVVSSANFRSLTDGWEEEQLLVYRVNRAGDRTQPCGEPVLVDSEALQNNVLLLFIGHTSADSPKLPIGYHTQSADSSADSLSSIHWPISFLPPYLSCFSLPIFAASSASFLQPTSTPAVASN